MHMPFPASLPLFLSDQIIPRSSFTALPPFPISRPTPYTPMPYALNPMPYRAYALTGIV